MLIMHLPVLVDQVEAPSLLDFPKLVDSHLRQVVIVKIQIKQGQLKFEIHLKQEAEPRYFGFVANLQTEFEQQREFQLLNPLEARLALQVQYHFLAEGCLGTQKSFQPKLLAMVALVMITLVVVAQTLKLLVATHLRLVAIETLDSKLLLESLTQ